MNTSTMIRPDTGVGAKLMVALTAVLLSAWSLLHMGGNLLVFAGPDLINRYGRALQQSPLLWAMRGGLLLCVTLHAAHAMRLWWRNRGASGPCPARRAFRTASVSSRTMGLSGPLLGALIAYHVLHIYGAGHASYRPGDVHHNLVAGLAQPTTAIAYSALAALFGLHLAHGLQSACRTLGWERGARWPGLRWLAVALALGFCAPAVAVQADLL